MESLLEGLEENRMDALYLFITDVLRDGTEFRRYFWNLLSILPNNYSVHRIEAGHEFLKQMLVHSTNDNRNHNNNNNTAAAQHEQELLFRTIAQLESLRTLIISDGYVQRKDMGAVITPVFLQELPRATNLVSLDIHRLELASFREVELLALACESMAESLEELRLTGLFLYTSQQQKDDRPQQQQQQSTQQSATTITTATSRRSSRSTRKKRRSKREKHDSAAALQVGTAPLDPLLQVLLEFHHLRSLTLGLYPNSLLHEIEPPPRQQQQRTRHQRRQRQEPPQPQPQGNNHDNDDNNDNNNNNNQPPQQHQPLPHNNQDAPNAPPPPGQEAPILRNPPAAAAAAEPNNNNHNNHRNNTTTSWYQHPSIVVSPYLWYRLLSGLSSTLQELTLRHMQLNDDACYWIAQALKPSSSSLMMDNVYNNNHHHHHNELSHLAATSGPALAAAAAAICANAAVRSGGGGTAMTDLYNHTNKAGKTATTKNGNNSQTNEEDDDDDDENSVSSGPTAESPSSASSTAASSTSASSSSASFLSTLDLRKNTPGITTVGYQYIARALELNFSSWCTVTVDDPQQQAIYHILIELNQQNRGDVVRNFSMANFVPFVVNLQESAVYHFLRIHDTVRNPLAAYLLFQTQKRKEREQQRQQKEKEQQQRHPKSEIVRKRKAEQQVTY